MFFPSIVRRHAAVLLLGISAAMLLAPDLRSKQDGTVNQEKKADPWTNAQVLEAADLVREMGNSKGGSAPAGTASKVEGLAELKKWAGALPRSTNLVIYCGCCPFDRCPNIRPAYTEVHDLGFTHVRVLVLPTSFAADWVEKGYPMQKGL